MSALALLFLATASASATGFSQWLPTETVKPDESYLDTAAVAMGENGNATLVWTESGRGGELRGAYLPSTGEWDTEEVLNVVEVNTTLYYPSVVMDGEGRAACVWLQYWSDDLNGTYPVDAYVNRYEPGTGWQGPEWVGHIGIGYIVPAAIAYGGPGELFVAWSDHITDGLSTIRARHFLPGSGWGTDVMLDQNSTTRFPEFPAVAADEERSAVVAWTVSDENGSTREVKGAVFYPGSGGWQPTERLDAKLGGGAFLDGVAVGGSIPTVLLSEYDEAGIVAQFVSRSWLGGGWDAPLVVDPDNIGPREAKIVGDPSGRLTAIYTKRIAGVISVNGSSFTPGVGWHPWGLIETLDVNATLLSIASDNDGGAVGAWLGRNATRTAIGAARFRPSFGWEEAPAFHDTYETVSFPSVGASKGSAIVAWVGVSGFHDVRAARFERDTEPPLVLMTSPVSPLVNSTEVLVGGTCFEYPCVVNIGGNTVVASGLDGSFAFTFNLTDGPHTVWVYAYDREGNTNVTAAAFTVDTFSYLALTSPAVVVTSSELVAISGQAEPGSQVFVNGTAAAVTPDGAFLRVYIPGPGTHRVTIEAVDLAGNRNATSVTVTFADPAAALQQALDDANATLNAAVGDLAAAEVRLAALEVDQAATEAELASARANVTAAKAAADLASGQVLLAQANVTAAQQSAASAQARAERADQAAAGAQTLAIIGIVMGLIGAAIGAVALVRSGGGGGMHPKEKGSRTKSSEAGARPGEPAETADALKVKEKGNRTK